MVSQLPPPPPQNLTDHSPGEVSVISPFTSALVCEITTAIRGTGPVIIFTRSEGDEEGISGWGAWACHMSVGDSHNSAPQICSNMSPPRHALKTVFKTFE